MSGSSWASRLTVTGPFVSAGLQTPIGLLVGFVVVCAAEVVIGLSLVAGCAPALWIQFASVPFELAYWWGFALPFGFVLGVARVTVAVLALTQRTGPKLSSDVVPARTFRQQRVAPILGAQARPAVDPVAGEPHARP